ncbi:MAG: LytTR family transcriptional regulator DNA-binding domain-containing protein [Spirochaetes bacterium]|jgi:DNA-binding LytR/AlgR family response regulator|nr:LytTR family transcriptional regulator DNA-binding domain-containing protein [Spirochaetota bacterium]
MKRTIITIICLLGVSAARASVMKVSDHDLKISVVPYASYLKDPTKKLTITDVIASDNFNACTDPILKFGYIEASVWVKFTILNSGSREKLLQLAEASIDNVEFYQIKNGTIISSEKEIGDRSPFKNRKIPHRTCLFKIPSDPAPYTYYLRMQSGNYLTAPLILWSYETFVSDDNIALAFSWVFFAMLMVMAIYNLVVFVSVREKLYHLFYVFLNISMALHHICWKGLAYQYFFPESTAFTHGLTAFLLLLSLGIVPIFSTYYLELDRFLIFKAVSYIFFIYLIFITLHLIFFESNIMSMPTIIIGITYFIFFLGYSMVLAARGSKPARFYLSSWLFLILALILTISYTSGFFYIPIVSEYSPHIGMMMQTILLSFGLSDKIGTMRRELAVIKVDLEKKVEKRTEELHAALVEMKEINTSLTSANRDLEKAHSGKGADLPRLSNPAFSFRENRKQYLVPLEDIIYFSSQGKHTVIHTKDQDFETSQVMKSIEEKLPPSMFIRIHKQYMVNIKFISHLQHDSGGMYTLFLKDEDDSSFPVGRAFLPDLKSLIQ